VNRQIVRRLWSTLTLALTLTGAGQAHAACMSLTSGPIVYDVTGCKDLQPEALFDTHKSKYSWIAGLDPAGRKKFFNSYRGAYLRGKVVQSHATQKGLVSGDSSALSGQTIYTYVLPGSGQCSALLGRRIAAQLHEVCCEGGGDVPCLLNTGYVLLSPKVEGSANSGAGDQVRQRAKLSKDVKAGEIAFRAHRWQEAIKSFEKARTNNELDVKGSYMLADALREVEQCKDAIPILKKTYDASLRKETWADEEKVVRLSNFLLARCYAKMNNPQGAVLILNGYLLDPHKFHWELEESLKNKDFGWIHTSNEYRDFEKDVRKKLKK